VTRTGTPVRVAVPDPDALLDAWWITTDLVCETEMLLGYVPNVSGPELLQRVAQHFAAAGVDFAATGYAAAWLQGLMSRFPTLTLYVRARPEWQVLWDLGMLNQVRPDLPYNLALLTPRERDPFRTATPVQGIPCVPPLRLYLDLKAEPGPSHLLADVVRSRHLAWPSRGPYLHAQRPECVAAKYFHSGRRALLWSPPLSPLDERCVARHVESEHLSLIACHVGPLAPWDEAWAQDLAAHALAIGATDIVVYVPVNHPCGSVLMVYPRLPDGLEVPPLRYHVLSRG
jgi:hypothetical protein